MSKLIGELYNSISQLNTYFTNSNNNILLFCLNNTHVAPHVFSEHYSPMFEQKRKLMNKKYNARNYKSNEILFLI